MQGWKSKFSEFSLTEASTVTNKLQQLFPSSEQQIFAWRSSIPEIQRELGYVIKIKTNSSKFFCILEYELPYESRRPDAVFLTDNSVIVTEIKSTVEKRLSDIDQVDAYARDLRAYHKYCHDKPVVPALMLMKAKNLRESENGIFTISPDQLHGIIHENSADGDINEENLNLFIDDESYAPMPSLIKAARELFKEKGKIRRIHRASAATDPAIKTITKISMKAFNEKRRKLVLLTGVPGAGKTLVGLRLVHSDFLDSIKSDSDDTKAPAVFLSGNGPLVEVLQYELKDAGGGGKTFVRGVKDYVKRYSKRDDLIPPEHILVFDEAQRAWDKNQVSFKHNIDIGLAKSEPELFIQFAERIPDWCMVVGLIGTGQEIHLGEEGGVGQWADAINGSNKKSSWDICGPETLQSIFESSGQYQSYSSLSLDEEIRYHSAQYLHIFVEKLLSGATSEMNSNLADYLAKESYHLRITRDLSKAKEYLRERYKENLDARFGLLASSKDKDLVNFSIPNDFQSTKRIRNGPWYVDEENVEGSQSCRLLKTCVTEFGAQGLELDTALVAWGTDLVYRDGKWDNSKARGYRNKHLLKSPMDLRINSYRVLLTRGRDATVIYLPTLSELDETYDYLIQSGWKSL